VKLSIIPVVVVAIVLPIFSFAQNKSTPKEPLVVVKGGRYGYINHDGGVVIPPQFVWGEDFQDGIATVYVCGRLVSLTESGRFEPLRYSSSAVGLAPHREGEKFGFVDSKGQFKIAPVFADALPFSDGLAAVKLGDFWGFIDTSGHLVVQPLFQAAYYFREGVANAEKEGNYVLIDKTARVLARGYEQVRGIVAEGRVPVSREGKFGYLDLNGNVVIPLVYDDLDSFGDGLAPVQKGEKWGYIDRDGHAAIPFIFDKAGNFASGLAPVRIAEQSGFIDRAGKFAFQLQFDYAPGFLTGDADGMLAAETDVSRFWTADKAFGYVNRSGKVIWGPMAEGPDHAPLVGWSAKDKTASCEGVPDQLRKTIAAFPE
jgi:hypothetical protein